MSSGDWTGAADAFANTGMRARRTGIRSSTGARRSAAGRIRLV